MIPSGAVFFILISAVLLAAALAWVVAALYQRGMLALMRGGVPPAGAMISENQSALNPAAQLEPVTAAETNKADLGTNRHASVRLMLVLSGISLLIALLIAAAFFLWKLRSSPRTEEPVTLIEFPEAPVESEIPPVVIPDMPEVVAQTVATDAAAPAPAKAPSKRKAKEKAAPPAETPPAAPAQTTEIQRRTT